MIRLIQGIIQWKDKLILRNKKRIAMRTISKRNPDIIQMVAGHSVPRKVIDSKDRGMPDTFFDGQHQIDTIKRNTIISNSDPIAVPNLNRWLDDVKDKHHG